MLFRSGFRLAAGGAQQALNIDADLVTYGKVIGAGLPVGAFGGKREIMECIAPLGKVYQAGTLSGNPVAMIAGYTLLNELKNTPSIYSELNEKTMLLKKRMTEIFESNKIPVQINQLGSMISVHFTKEPVVDFASSARSEQDKFSLFFHHMLKSGIYLPPSAFESWFLNNALSATDINKTVEAVAAFR